MSAVLQVQTSPTASRQAALFYYPYTAVTADDTANSVAITMLDASKIQKVISIQIESTTGVRRAPQGVVSVATNVVTVADTGLAVNEIIHVLAEGYAS